MSVARAKLGLKNHFQIILNTWAGKEVTHVKITETIDELGQIIDQTRTESTIYGIVGDANFKGNNQPIGLLQPGDLCANFKYEDNVIVSDQLTESTTRHDHIIFQEVEYRVEDIEIAYDVLVSQTSHEPVFTKHLLRKTII